MTAPEVTYVLDRLEAVETDQPADHPLFRINKDESVNLTTGERKRSVDLARGNVVTVSRGSDSPSVRGHEYNIDNTVSVTATVEGVHWHEEGHIDPEGVNGVSFKSLKDAIKARLYADATYPDVGGDDHYRNILPITETDTSSDNKDHFRVSLEIPFSKVEER